MTVRASGGSNAGIGEGLPMLSGDARQFLTELQHQPEPLLCLECTGMRLSLTKWEVTKLIGELIDGDAVHCRFTRCESCLNRTMVVITGRR